MDKTTLDIIKLRWQVLILQRMLAKLFAVSFADTGASPEEVLRVVLAGLEAEQKSGFETLLSPAVPDDERVLLAEEFAQVVEDMKTSFTSILKDS